MGYALSEKDKENPENEVLTGSPDFKVSPKMRTAHVGFGRGLLEECLPGDEGGLSTQINKLSHSVIIVVQGGVHQLPTQR